MRSFVIAALCAAPLVLAGNIQQDLAVRGVVTPERSEVIVEGKDSVTVQSSSGDVVIIWTNQGGEGASTKTVTATQTVTAAGAATQAAAAAAATHTVVVGGAAGLVYSPDSITAAVGDMVVFQFMSQNHTVTQSAFAAPCVKLATGMDSGFMPNANNSVTPAPAMAMQVMTADPTWFYCRQTGHCGKGMVFSINPSTNKTQANFQSLAIAQNGTGASTAITGGTAAGSSGSSSSVASSASSVATTVAGTGTTQADGSCACSCLCGEAAFPKAAVQGLGMFGGVSGAMPMSLLEV